MSKRNRAQHGKMTFSFPEDSRGEAAAATPCVQSYELSEWAVLHMMRRLFVGEAEGNDRGVWEAQRVGEIYFDAASSAAIVAALREYVDLLRRTRRSTFMFKNPRCPCCRSRVTSDERLMMSIIRSQRNGGGDVAIKGALDLCEGVCDENFLKAAERVGAVINRLEVGAHSKHLH